jgi:hypothetical protein
MTESRVQEVDSLQGLEGLYAEDTSHGHVAQGTDDSPELQDLVSNLIGWVGGRTFSPAARTKQEHWDAVRARLESEGLKLWVEMVPAVGISAATSEGQPLAPPIRTNVYAFHIAPERPRTGFGDA